jgi:hypothetical protein
MAVADRHGQPVGIYIESASPHEVKLVECTLVEMVIPEAPKIWWVTMLTTQTTWTLN